MNFLICLLSAGYLAYLIACGHVSSAMYGTFGLSLLALIAQIVEDMQ